MLAAKISRFLDTPELLRARPELLPIPHGGTAASLELPLQILEVDEFGILVSTGYLMKKGSAFKLEAP